MQKKATGSSFPDTGSEEPAAMTYRAMDNLAVTWSIGIGIGYAFLAGFIVWIAYRCFLVWTAYQAGDYPAIVSELQMDVLISVVYFGIGGVLMKAEYL